MDAKERGSKYSELVNSYYNLATDFYEWVRACQKSPARRCAPPHLQSIPSRQCVPSIRQGWGQSFHFANKLAGETFAASIARHEYYLAMRLGVQVGSCRF